MVLPIETPTDQGDNRRTSNQDAVVTESAREGACSRDHHRPQHHRERQRHLEYMHEGKGRYLVRDERRAPSLTRLWGGIHELSSQAGSDQPIEDDPSQHRGDPENKGGQRENGAIAGRVQPPRQPQSAEKPQGKAEQRDRVYLDQTTSQRLVSCRIEHPMARWMKTQCH